MSRPPREPPRKSLSGPDGASPVGPMTLSGVVKTSRGFAVAIAVMNPDGNVTLTLGNSQAFPEHVALEHRRVATKATLKAQGG